MALGIGLFLLFPSQVKVSLFQFARFFCYCYSLPALPRGERVAVWVLGWCLGSAQRSPRGSSAGHLRLACPTHGPA